MSRANRTTERMVVVSDVKIRLNIEELDRLLGGRLFSSVTFAGTGSKGLVGTAVYPVEKAIFALEPLACQKIRRRCMYGED
jgi:hypothetical protein